MKLESISKKTGKLTAKTLDAVKSAPVKTGNKTKAVKDAFVSGYKQNSTPKIKKSEPTEVLTVDDIFGDGK